VKVGMLGGGSKEVLDITVSTYDSAVLMMEFIGAKFGLAVYDECHHLPGQVNRLSASMCLAPYRLGLTATPERDDGLDAVMTQLLGPTVYASQIDELEGRVLAPYIVKRVAVDLSEAEYAAYSEARKVYTDFLKGFNISFGARGDWRRFIALASRSPRGRLAFEAYLKQRAIARCGQAKLLMVWRLMAAHPEGRILVFTADNDTAYKIGEMLCLPVLTHKTKATERKDFLDKFRSGEYSALVTSKVLNEGVDVPEASVGIIVSGSASAREHVQRLGRILRARDGKQAILYELVSSGTSEMSVSERRSSNRAYSRVEDFDGFDGSEV
jgi:superfamily II DNA or RNA helicase